MNEITSNYMRYSEDEVYNIMHRIEIDIIEQCNYRCKACSRSCGNAPSAERMTIEQIEVFVNDSIRLNWQWNSIMIIGGEPTMHPNLLEIIKVIKKYKDFNRACIIRLMTNGSDVAKKVLPVIPSWVVIQNNAKTKLTKYQGHYMPFCVAPADIGEWDQYNLVKCNRPCMCGMGLTKDGFFLCHLSGGIHRVFGLEKGIEKLDDVTFESLNKLLPLSCKYCGFYFEAGERYKKYDINIITKSWEEAYKNYNNIVKIKKISE